MTTIDITIAVVTAIVAVYGAVLATYNLLVERASRTPRVGISLHIGTKHPDGPEWEEPHVFVRVGNRGRVPVHLAMWGLCVGREEIPFGAYSKFTEVEVVPVELAPGKGIVFKVPLATLIALTKQRNMNSPVLSCQAYVLDQLGTRYSSTAFDSNASDWLGMISHSDRLARPRVESAPSPPVAD